MKERPILFQGAMVRAILGGFKTHTRRMIKEPPDKMTAGFGICPYGVKGDGLWVRESFCKSGSATWRSFLYKADCHELIDGARWTPSIHMTRRASRINLELTDDPRCDRVADITPEDVFKEGIPRKWEDAQRIGLIPILDKGSDVSGCRVNMLENRYKLLCVEDPTILFKYLWNAINGKPKPVYVSTGERTPSGKPKKVIDHYVSYPFDGNPRTSEYRGRPWHIHPNPWVWVVPFKRI